MTVLAGSTASAEDPQLNLGESAFALRHAFGVQTMPDAVDIIRASRRFLSVISLGRALVWARRFVSEGNDAHDRLPTGAMPNAHRFEDNSLLKLSSNVSTS